MSGKRGDVRFGSYEGVVEKWKVRLAVSRIRAFKLPKDDWEDALQDIVVAIHEFEFDPARANGAKESTALCQLINNLLCNQIRSRVRHRRKMEAYATTSTLEFDEETGEAVDGHEEEDFTAADVATVVASLTPRQREVCVRYARGESLRKIGRAMGLRWDRVRAILRSSRRRFEKAGFGLEGQA
jgi:RNA polymerase sigma factor (sigma-70 family)